MPFNCLHESAFRCQRYFPESFTRIVRIITYLCADKRCPLGAFMNIPGGLPQPSHAV